MSEETLELKFCVVDSHHKVLTPWAQHRRTVEKSARLITLDHHTDTSEPFRRFIKNSGNEKIALEDFRSLQEALLNKIDFNDEGSIREALLKLNNDEHILAAIKSKIISSAFVVAHNAAKTGLEIFNEHKISCFPVSESLSATGHMAPDFDQVLESPFLDKALEGFNEILSQANLPLILDEPYILDIDLDYFNTFKSIAPRDSSTFKTLVKNAELVTVATEPEYVQSCAIDPGLDSDFLLSSLKKLISEISEQSV